MLKALIVFVLAVLAVLAYAALQPDKFQIQRSLRIQAPPERVFALVNNLEQFNRWNPWLKKDPASKGSYGETISGRGARYAWDGPKLGAGEMTVVESIAPGKVGLKLDFVSPFEAHNRAEFAIAPDGDGSRVTWTMEGANNFMSKLMQVFVKMDDMVGPDFEAGLAGLKSLAEAR